jgi:parallel beta-helix repeat protein
MKNLTAIFLAALTVCLCGSLQAQTTYYVEPGESIQAAIDGASNGDEIEVAAGTYYEAINFTGKAVRLYSLGGPEVTTIDASGLKSSVVVCASGEDANSILEGFTLTGGIGMTDSEYRYGGGMYNYVSRATVTNCIFSGNTATNYGGGIYNNGSSPTVTDCTFSGNSSVDGGGIYNYDSSPKVTNCMFSGNSAEWSGGGMSNELSSPTVGDCSFTENTANMGGGMYNLSNGPTVTECIFIGNSAMWSGGGMYNELSSPMLTNCVFWNNSANDGGGMYNYDNSSPTLTNCILWGDTPEEIFNDNSNATVTYSDVEDGYTGTGNIDADPEFVDAAGGDFRLSSSASACVDAGDNSTPGLPTTDLAGNPRVVDGDGDGTAVVDMGAFELQAGVVHNITQDIWYETIQLSIDDSDNGDEIEVAAGTYYEAINFTGKAVRLYSSGGAEVTTIDASGLDSSVVTCSSGEDENSIIEGFTIRGGTGSENAYGQLCGGGMYNYVSRAKVINCTFSGNSALYGGGIYNHNSSPTVTDCTFIGNLAGYYGGGMFNMGGSPMVSNCSFSNNIAYAGGGMYNLNSSPTLTNCIFSGNTATTNYGGGIYNMSGSPMVTNCTFSGNSAELGGGMFNVSSSPTVTNCTFSSNTANDCGGGMFNSSSTLTVTNSILWNDTPDEIFNEGNSSNTITYSDVEGGYAGEGNIDADPNFADANGGNLHLLSNSQCIDAGNSTPLLDLIVSEDLDGMMRFVDIAAVPNTGIGLFEFVDMGAYEFNCDYTHGDSNCDGKVDIKDFAILADNWLEGV